MLSSSEPLDEQLGAKSASQLPAQHATRRREAIVRAGECFVENDVMRVLLRCSLESVVAVIASRSGDRISMTCLAVAPYRPCLETWCFETWCFETWCFETWCFADLVLPRGCVLEPVASRPGLICQGASRVERAYRAKAFHI